jgi:hypothetical protein
VEVRGIVIAVEHGDRDPVERADSWHHSNVRTVCDTARTGHHNPTGYARPYLRWGCVGECGAQSVRVWVLPCRCPVYARR